MRTTCCMLALAGAMLGCGTESGTELVVEELRMSGELDGRVLDEANYEAASGGRFIGSERFVAEGPGGWLEVTTCPLNDIATDPYATNEDPGLPPRDEIPAEGTPEGAPTRRSDGTIFGNTCFGNSLGLCDETGCTGLGEDLLQVEIIDLGDDRRQLVLDGALDNSAVHVEILYRERS